MVVFGFFSVSSSKLASYILPLFPALAALVGLHIAGLARSNPAALRWQTLPAIVLSLAGLYFAPQVVEMSSSQVPAELYENYIPWLQAACTALLICGLAAFAFAHAARPRASVLSLACGGMLFAQLALLGHDSLAPSNSAAQIVERIRDQVKAGVPFFSVNIYDQSLPFYLKRTVTMVFYMDELGFGIAQEPQKFIGDKNAFVQAWQAAPDAWALMDPDTYRNFLDDSLPMRIVTQDSRRIIVRKP
jgi:4-amino-4-deoxy-L-arabinose transferase-like glycosyltransferase